MNYFHTELGNVSRDAASRDVKGSRPRRDRVVHVERPRCFCPETETRPRRRKKRLETVSRPRRSRPRLHPCCFRRVADNVSRSIVPLYVGNRQLGGLDGAAAVDLVFDIVSSNTCARSTQEAQLMLDERLSRDVVSVLNVSVSRRFFRRLGLAT